jgi:uncharacterized membrane protein YfbV (UPF0208 family)
VVHREAAAASGIYHGGQRARTETINDTKVWIRELGNRLMNRGLVGGEKDSRQRPPAPQYGRTKKIRIE